MKTVQPFVFAAALLCSSFLDAEEVPPVKPPAWLTQAEDALSGTWLSTDEKTQSIPKIEIFRENTVLKARFWGRTHPQDTPFKTPEPLLVLSDHSDPANRSKTPPLATAFATHDAVFALLYFKLTLTKEGLQVETIEIFTDSSKRSNRITFTSYRKQ